MFRCYLRRARTQANRVVMRRWQQCWSTALSSSAGRPSRSSTYSAFSATRSTTPAGSTISDWFYHVSVVPVFSNSCINPLTYAAKYSEFQTGVRRMVARSKVRPLQNVVRGLAINTIFTRPTRTTTVIWRAVFAVSGPTFRLQNLRNKVNISN